MIKSLAHLCILSGDLNRTLDFYVGILGLRKKFDFIRNGALFGFYLEVAPGQFIEVFHTDAPAPDRASAGSITHLCLEVADIDAVRGRLVAKGVEVTEKKLGADSSWQAWCKDPDGTAIEFHQYTPGSCQLTGAECVVDW
jgi:lactoylglutathione lyase/glyoxylase I family protein